MNFEELLTVHEAANYLRIKPSTLRLWRLQGRLPVVKIGGAIRFRREDLNSFIKESIIPVSPKCDLTAGAGPGTIGE